jgi:hypothetical protein
MTLDSRASGVWSLGILDTTVQPFLLIVRTRRIVTAGDHADE